MHPEQVGFCESCVLQVTEITFCRLRFYPICGDLLTPIIDPMSLLEPLPSDDEFNFGDRERTSGGLANVAEFVDPQYTVKRCGTTQLGFMTPETSPTDTTPRRESFASSYFCGSSAASSFMSHSGCGTPSLTTPGSSASNSRRQSMLLPECQQYYLSAIDSSPTNHPQGPKVPAAADQCSLQEPSAGSYLAGVNAASLIADGAAACVPGSDFTMVVDDFIGKAPKHWQGYSPETAISSLYGRTGGAAQIEESTSWSGDLMAKLNSQIATRDPHNLEFSQPPFGYAQPTIFENTPSQQDGDPYNTEGNSSPNTPSLAPAFEYDTGIGFADNDIASGIATTGRSFRGIFIGKPPDNKLSPPSDDGLERDHAVSRTVQSHNKKSRQSQKAMCEWNSYRRESKSKSHRCRVCGYACNRPEHLRRHEQSKHMEDKTEVHLCAFRGCLDRKTGKHREIKARSDNLKMHYTNTHFRYGGSEKGAKNERKSMKAAYEMGLSIYDSRWTLLLQKKMNVNQEIDKHLHVWKMIGYSILETRDIKVEDVVPDWRTLVPDWPGPEDPTLQEFDPRWRALWDGTLTFEKAMSKGRFMHETDAQGLLGVTMLETEAMGIKHLDPRWTVLLSGHMSVDQSEKLGVKQRNPNWKDLVTRRRARL